MSPPPRLRLPHQGIPACSQGVGGPQPSPGSQKWSWVLAKLLPQLRLPGHLASTPHPSAPMNLASRALTVWDLEAQHRQSLHPVTQAFCSGSLRARRPPAHPRASVCPSEEWAETPT